MTGPVCRHCGGPLYIPVINDHGQEEGIPEPNCVAGDEMCYNCWLRLLEGLSPKPGESSAPTGGRVWHDD